jgi:KipI family sensor histidine kinase inhibitor
MYKIILAGENSILIYFADKIDKSLPSNIANFANALKNKFTDVVIDLIPSYTSLLVTYNLNKINYLQFSTNVQTLLDDFEFSSINQNSNLIRIPVYYDFATGLDLKRLLAEKNLTIKEFIKIHSSKSYLVYAIGFSPVFAFLGEVDKRIQAPRLSTPRIKIPAGSVGIADSQTAIYPTNSSAGWNIIGRTMLDLSLNNPDNLHKFKTGDRVKFYAISRDEFIKYGGKL